MAGQVGAQAVDELLRVAVVDEDLDLQALGMSAHLLGGAGDALRIAVALDVAGGERYDPFGMLQQVVEDARLEPWTASADTVQGRPSAAARAIRSTAAA